MPRTVVLDSGPVGLLSHPSEAPDPQRAWRWAESLVARGVRKSLELDHGRRDVTVATTNPNHIAQYVDAAHWWEIT